ncbi:MAG: glycosyltransferase [Oceanospirillaceae bacterium]
MIEADLNKPRILVFVGYYYPGHKAGGPLRTILNMVDHLSDKFDFCIVTRDRDLGDALPYENVFINKWVKVGQSQVYYCSPEKQTLSGFSKIINNTPHDLLYLNSFFDHIFTFKPLILRLFGVLADVPTLLAVRGEFSSAALRLKRFKKMGYILVSKIFGLYKNLIWHASSSLEAKDIWKSFSGVNILVALDLPSKLNLELVNEQSQSSNPESSVLRIVFLSRISPMKNLDYSLRVLKQVHAEIVFDIYGPIEDLAYWKNCQTLIKALPRNIKAEYCGPVLPEEVRNVFSRYDLFILPTRGENYGHVIAESLSVGTTVLLSDQTPWRDLSNDKLGWDIALDEIARFVDVLESVAATSAIAKKEIRDGIISTMEKKLSDPALLFANKQLFYKCLQH